MSPSDRRWLVGWCFALLIVLVLMVTFMINVSPYP